MIRAPWHLLRQLVHAANSLRDDAAPSFVAENDQVQAWAMQRLSELSIDVRLEGDLYGVLAVVGFLYECATNGGRRDVFTAEQERGIKSLLLTVTDALAPLIPDEVRP